MGTRRKIKKAEKAAAANPLKITAQQIKQHLLADGIFDDDTQAGLKAEQILDRIKMFVSAKYQDEVDYFLAKHEPSQSEVGQDIQRSMRIGEGMFFYALMNVAILMA